MFFGKAKLHPGPCYPFSCQKGTLRRESRSLCPSVSCSQDPTIPQLGANHTPTESCSAFLVPCPESPHTAFRNTDWGCTSADPLKLVCTLTPACSLKMTVSLSSLWDVGGILCPQPSLSLVAAAFVISLRRATSGTLAHPNEYLSDESGCCARWSKGAVDKHFIF